MSAGKLNANGAPGWAGHVVNYVAVGTLDDGAESNLYDPPLRMLVAGADGNVVVTLHGDDTADASKKVTLPIKAGLATAIKAMAIRKIWATSTTATGLQGFR